MSDSTLVMCIIILVLIFGLLIVDDILKEKEQSHCCHCICEVKK